MMVAMAAEEPVTRLFGRSPAGMNSTGESDARFWYDVVGAHRQQILKPAIEQAALFVFRSQLGPTGGEVPEKWEIKFPPLWQETPLERAQRLNLLADADTKWIAAEMIHSAEATLSRFRPEGVSDQYQVDLDRRKAELDARPSIEEEQAQAEEMAKQIEAAGAAQPSDPAAGDQGEKPVTQ